MRVEDVWERNVLHRRNKSESPRAGVGGQVRKSREAGWRRVWEHGGIALMDRWSG